MFKNTHVKQSIISKNSSKLSNTVQSSKLQPKEHKKLFTQRKFQLKDHSNKNGQQTIEIGAQRQILQTPTIKDNIYTTNYNSIEIEQTSEIIISRASNACESVKIGTLLASANDTPQTMISDGHSKEVSQRLTPIRGNGLQAKTFD